MIFFPNVRDSHAAQITSEFRSPKDDRIVPSSRALLWRSFRLLRVGRKPRDIEIRIFYRGLSAGSTFFFRGCWSARGVGFACVLNGATTVLRKEPRAIRFSQHRSHADRLNRTRHDRMGFFLSTHATFLPNVQDEPRPGLARLVLLGARDVTAWSLALAPC